MAHGGYSSDVSEMSAEEEQPSYNLPTQNRFDIDDGRGNGWVVEGTGGKRKKVSTGSINSECFSQLNQTEQLTCLFNRLNRNYEKINSVEQNQRKCLSDINTTQKSVDDVNNRVDRTEKFIDLQMRKLKMLSYKSIDMEARSRRNNIVFWGITEKNSKECNQLILNFMKYELEIDTREMCIDRAHRLGSENSKINRSKSDPKRPIIVRFRDYCDTDTSVCIPRDFLLQLSAIFCNILLDSESKYKDRSTTAPVEKQHTTLYNKADQDESVMNSTDDGTRCRLLIRDHHFDTQNIVSVKGKKKTANICTDRNAVKRGSIGVRWEGARRNDSKLLATTMIGYIFDGIVLLIGNC